MGYLGHKFKMEIKDILELPCYQEDQAYGFEELEMFTSLGCLQTWGMDLETPRKVIGRELVTDRTFDCRSRQLTVLIYDGKPFAIYQYIGRGDFRNETIFDKETYLKLMSDYMKEYVSKLDDLKIQPINYEYEINNYDFGVFIEDEGKLVSVCKTKLKEMGIEVN